MKLVSTERADATAEREAGSKDLSETATSFTPNPHPLYVQVDEAERPCMKRHMDRAAQQLSSWHSPAKVHEVDNTCPGVVGAVGEGEVDAADIGVADTVHHWCLVAAEPDRVHSRRYQTDAVDGLALKTWGG